MTKAQEPCPLCETVTNIRHDMARQISMVDCPCCGQYECQLDFVLETVEEPFYLLTSFLRKRFARTGHPYRFSDRENGRFPQGLKDLPVPQKLNQALLCVARQSRGFGRTSKCDPQVDWPLAQAQDRGEFAEMLEYWRLQGALEGNPLDQVALTAQGGLTMTGKGWMIVEELEPTHGIGTARNAFVAMSFREDMASIYDNAIDPALRECGWTPIRVDRAQFEEKICDRIISEIRQANLVVVECTGSSQSVYFEAGFAMGLNIPVVWCARKDHLDQKLVAFDTRQYPHLPWTSEGHLRTLLIDRIRSLYGKQKDLV